MSAFVVDDQTINKVVSYLHVKAVASGPDLHMTGTKLAKMGFDLRDLEDCIRLAETMFELNVAAVNARYGEGEAEKFRPLNFRFHFQPERIIRVIKALESWSYQCAEREIPHLRLYQAMDEIHCMLCISAVHSSTEYEGVRGG